jgi:hypothetical protein
LREPDVNFAGFAACQSSRADYIRAMLCRISFLLAGLLSAPMLHAQVKVEVLLRQERKQEQKQYLVKEPLEIGVRVVNHSGQKLNLTKGDWLSISVMDENDFAVKQIGAMPVAEDVSIESSYMATQWLDIGQTFDFKENARYSIRARVDVFDWSRDFYTDAKYFEMIRGASLWEQKFGVPVKTPGELPEIRNYILQQALYLAEPQLYLRITDDSGKTVHAVERLAPMIQVSRPEAQVDTLSRLHVFTQISMKDFVHIIIDPDGTIQQRDTYMIEGYRPTLKVSPSGGVYVAGGIRQLRRTDIPTPSVFLATAATATLQDQQINPETGLPEPPAVEPAPTAPPSDPFKQAHEELEKMSINGNKPDSETISEQ